MLISISETEFSCIAVDETTVELADEQAEQFNSATDLLFFVDGKLVSREEKQWAENPEAVKNNIRHQRNHLLAASDWTQLIDSPLDETARDAWAVYRQALRDLTDNIDVNGKVEFPVAP